MSRPIRKIFPTAKLTTENAGDVELTSHRRAITAAAAPPQPQSPPSLPCSGPPNPVEPTPAVVTVSPTSVPAHVSTTTKRSRSLLQAASFGSIQTVPDDPTDSDNAPKVKKSKATLQQVGLALETDVLIIKIDGDDQQVKRLSKINPTADIKAFFTEIPHVLGQNKVHMKCKPCT